MKSINPKPLQKKDCIYITAPSGALKKEDLDFALHLIEKKGFTAKIAPHCLDVYNFGYAYGGKPKDRVKDLQKGLDDPTIKAIWCARGGYGMVQLLDQLNFSSFKKNPKWIIGYSDITALHNQINLLGIPTIHGVTAKVLPGGNSPESYQDVFSILKGKSTQIEFFHPKNKPFKDFSGEIVGGNLSIVYSLLGSPSAVKTKNKILFLEDWYEDFYHLDRMLENLKRNGLFADAKAILIGGFTKMDTKEENPNYLGDFDQMAYRIICEKLKNLEVPVLFGVPSGHISHHLPLIFESKAKFSYKEDKVVIKFKPSF
ncbi:MAG: LD-carboxypeptidase [Flavobacteriaceae bacterium]|nr:MAG: LD-carboxypeptidase [Flavobacteriaceae bacterium]